MKNIFVGSMVAIALLTTPMAQAQSPVSNDPVVQAQIASLRIELIELMMQLLAQLQEQLDDRLAADTRQDNDITEIRNQVRDREEDPEVSADEEIAELRSRIARTEASALVQEEDGVYWVSFSVGNYLNIDDVEYSANFEALSTEGGCTPIQDSDYRVCGESAIYPISATSSDLVIDVEVNGDEKSLILDIDSSLQRVYWNL